MSDSLRDLTVEIGDDFVAVVEIHRPPNNYFDVGLVNDLVGVYRELDADPRCRAIVLCSEGKHFCAGADFVGRSSTAAPAGDTTRTL